MKGGESCLDTVGRKASVRARKHGPGDRKAAMERRGACASAKTHAAPQSAETVVRHAALHPPRFSGGHEGERRRTRRHKEYG
jgi:hypothetical protein